MKRAGRSRREGMVLLNVLLIVAIAAATVAIMISSEDIEVQRAIRLHDAAQAQAYSRAGELSAVVSLRRDGLTAPDMDAYSEPWADIGQQDISIPGGRFALSIADEQARYNLNALVRDDPVAASRFSRVARAAAIDPQTIVRIAAVVSAIGPLRDEGPLRTAGIAPAELDRLRPLVAYLPPDVQLNMNTAEPAVLNALIDDPRTVRALLERRSQRGQLTESDLAGLGLAGLGGFTSGHFLVTTVVSIGDVTQTTRSRLARRIAPEAAQVAVTARRRSGG